MKTTAKKNYEVEDEIAIGLFMGYQMASEEFVDKWLGFGVNHTTERKERFFKTHMHVVPTLMKEDGEPLFLYTSPHFKSYGRIMEVVDAIEKIEETVDFHYMHDPSQTFPAQITPYRVDIINRVMVEILKRGEVSVVMIDDAESKLEAIYKAVVKFCKMYNSKTLPV